MSGYNGLFTGLFKNGKYLAHAAKPVARSSPHGASQARRAYAHRNISKRGLRAFAPILSLYFAARDFSPMQALTFRLPARASPYFTMTRAALIAIIDGMKLPLPTTTRFRPGPLRLDLRHAHTLLFNASL